MEVNNVVELCCKRGGLRKCEVAVGFFVKESHDVDPFPVLRGVAMVHGVENFVGGVVAECIEGF